jgi:tetratricopeptide (TPR) repeat protein
MPAARGELIRGKRCGSTRPGARPLQPRRRLQDLGQVDAALLASYEAALRLDPRYALAWNNRGNTCAGSAACSKRWTATSAPSPSTPQLSRSLVPPRHRPARPGTPCRCRRQRRTGPGRAAGYADAFAGAGPRAAGAGPLRGQPSRPTTARSPCARPQAEIWCARGAALKKAGELCRALDSYDKALRCAPITHWPSTTAPTCCARWAGATRGRGVPPRARAGRDAAGSRSHWPRWANRSSRPRRRPTT